MSGRLRVGVDRGRGLLILVDTDAGTSLSIPWPPPEPKDGYGSWQPQVMERFPDGTALGLWRWDVDARPAAPWERADRPFNVPPWRDVLAPPAGEHADEVMREREDWDALRG